MIDQQRSGGPWYPWYRYRASSNLIDGRFIKATQGIWHRVEVTEYSARTALGYSRKACRLGDREEWGWS